MSPIIVGGTSVFLLASTFVARRRASRKEKIKEFLESSKKTHESREGKSGASTEKRSERKGTPTSGEFIPLMLYLVLGSPQRVQTLLLRTFQV